MRVPSFRLSLFAVDISGAQDVSALPSLADAPARPVAKTRLYDNGPEGSLANYEAICLGPRLADGSTALVLVSDAGDLAAPAILTLRLSRP